jgi:hypothetical protein
MDLLPREDWAFFMRLEGPTHGIKRRVQNMAHVAFILPLVAATALVPPVAADTLLAPLTPNPGPAPQIHGPKVYGARPGHPFLYRVPCTGIRPIRFSAEGLPADLHLDANTGIIAGKVPKRRGALAVTLHASNSKGTDSRPLKIVVGDTLALTPPMGWNDWYTHYDRITDKLMRQAADAMISSGLADFGYQYVNLDGCWTMKPGSKDPALNGEPRDAPPAGAFRSILRLRLEDLSDGGGQHLHRIRLLDERKLLRHSQAKGFLPAVSAGHQDRHVRPALPHFRERLHAAYNRHDDVEHDQSHGMTTQQFQRLPSIVGEQDPVAESFESSLSECADRFFVIDN